MRHKIEKVIPLSEMKIHRIRALYWSTDQMLSEALSQLDLTASQGCIMGYLGRQEKPPCPRDVEEAFKMSHSCVSGILSRLEKKGFIAFYPDEQDRRCKRISVLPKGRACLSHMQEAILRIEARMVQNFTPEEEAMFSQFLYRAINNMGGNPNGCPNKEE